MALWHPIFTAYEVHGARRETFIDNERASISTTVMVAAENAQAFADGMTWGRVYFPFEILPETYTLFNCVSAEIVQDKATYNSIADTTAPELPEGLESAHYAFVTLRYEPTLWWNTTWQEQNIFYTQEILCDVEYITLSHENFVWEDGVTKLRGPDEAPGKRFNFIKYHVVLEHVNDSGVIGDSDVAGKLIEGAGCVNQSPFLMWGTSKTYLAEQVLMIVNGIKKNCARNIIWYSTLDLTFAIRNQTCNGTVATWNKFWRPVQVNSQNAEGWYALKHIKTSSQGTPTYKQYPLSSAVNAFACPP